MSSHDVETLTQLPDVDHICFTKRIADHASVTPSHLAVVSPCRRLTFGELEREANQLAHYLCSLGVSRNSVVAICLPRSAEFVIAALAVLKSSGAYIPIDPDNPPDRIEFILSDTCPLAVVSTSYVACSLPKGQWQCIELDSIMPEFTNYPSTPPDLRCNPEDLAYVIYTSGST